MASTYTSGPGVFVSPTSKQVEDSSPELAAKEQHPRSESVTTGLLQVVRSRSPDDLLALFPTEGEQGAASSMLTGSSSTEGTGSCEKIQKKMISFGNYDLDLHPVRDVKMADKICRYSPFVNRVEQNHYTSARPKCGTPNMTRVRLRKSCVAIIRRKQLRPSRYLTNLLRKLGAEI